MFNTATIDLSWTDRNIQARRGSSDLAIATARMCAPHSCSLGTHANDAFILRLSTVLYAQGVLPVRLVCSIPKVASQLPGHNHRHCGLSCIGTLLCFWPRGPSRLSVCAQEKGNTAERDIKWATVHGFMFVMQACQRAGMHCSAQRVTGTAVRCCCQGRSFVHHPGALSPSRCCRSQKPCIELPLQQQKESAHNGCSITESSAC